MTARRAGLVALAVTLSWPGWASAALETVLQDDANLIHRPTEQVRASMQRIRALGVDRVRLTANWSALTRDGDARLRPKGFDAADPAAYEQARWRGLDQAVALARESGLQVLVDIGFWAPRWATTDGPGGQARSNVRSAAFADFAVAVAERYSGRFIPAPDATALTPPQDQTFLEALLGGGQPPVVPPPPPPGPLDRVEQFALWNEPNHPGLLLPQWLGRGRDARPASPAIYGRMLRAAYPVAKRARPDATFLVGNTSSIGDQGLSAVPPLLFIRELACVNRALRPLQSGACASFTQVPGDGWAHHPYNRNLRPDSRSLRAAPDDVMVGDLHRLSRLMRRMVEMGRVAPALRRIHLTEFGFETREIGSRPRVSFDDQGRWLTWAEYLSDRVPGVVSFAQFLLRDQPPAPVRVSDSFGRPFGQYYTGLQTTEGVDKPAAKSFTAGLFADRRRDGTDLLWGRLRLGAGPRDIGIERRRRDGRWEPLMEFRVDGQETFTRIVRARTAARYRLRWSLPDGTATTGLVIAPR